MSRKPVLTVQVAYGSRELRQHMDSGHISVPHVIFVPLQLLPGRRADVHFLASFHCYLMLSLLHHIDLIVSCNPPHRHRNIQAQRFQWVRSGSFHLFFPRLRLFPALHYLSVTFKERPDLVAGFAACNRIHFLIWHWAGEEFLRCGSLPYCPSTYRAGPHSHPAPKGPISVIRIR